MISDTDLRGIKLYGWAGLRHGVERETTAKDMAADLLELRREVREVARELKAEDELHRDMASRLFRAVRGDRE